GPAAEPGLSGDDEAGVHMHRRHIRIAHMRNQRNARRPETGILGGAGNLRAELRGKLAVHGGAMHADLLEQPSMHHTHLAAAAGLAGMVGALPWCAHETPGAARIERGGRIVLQLLEALADLVAQRFEPAPRPRLAILDHGHVHRRYPILPDASST